MLESNETEFAFLLLCSQGELTTFLCRHNMSRSKPATAEDVSILKRKQSARNYDVLGGYQTELEKGGFMCQHTHTHDVLREALYCFFFVCSSATVVAPPNMTINYSKNSGGRYTFVLLNRGTVTALELAISMK